MDGSNGLDNWDRWFDDRGGGSDGNGRNWGDWGRLLEFVRRETAWIGG